MRLALRSYLKYYVSVPVLEGSSKLVGVNGELKTKVAIARRIWEDLDDRVLTEYIATL